jgi:hypothetical protein
VIRRAKKVRDKAIDEYPIGIIHVHEEQCERETRAKRKERPTAVFLSQRIARTSAKTLLS